MYFPLRLIVGIFLFISLTACSSEEDDVDVSELPGQSWDVQLDGTRFNVPNTGIVALYDTDTDELTVSGIKSYTTEERIVLIFSLKNGTPFVEGQSLDLDEDSSHSILYFDGNGNRYSSHNLQGNGSFLVNKFIETDTRDYLEGRVNGVLFNEADSTSVSVSGSFAVKTF